MESAVGSLLGKVVCSLFGVAKKEISHVWNYSEIVENLKKEAKNLEDMKEMLQHQIDSAKHEGEVPLKCLEEWMNEADEKISQATKFIAEEAEVDKKYYSLSFCVNVGALYHYGKMATKKRYNLLQHQKDGRKFETSVSYPTPSPGFIDIYERKDLENIDTQKSTLKKIIQAINVFQIVGIDGLGGVGKTTLASEAAVELKNQFDYIEFLTISQTTDAKMIKGKVQVAARRIINGQKVLIILDDMWEELKLVEVGIPCGSDKMNCKIFLTSRNKDVCEAMNAQQIISVSPLEEKEAWALFERVVGKTEWDHKLKEVALKIVEECRGLPLFVQSIGKTLKHKKDNIWEAALRRLQAPIDGDATYKKNGLLQLKLSYNYLEDEVTKSCFLLCSMFPEDRTINLKRLTYYGLGLGIFNTPNSNIQSAKDIVQLAVESLKSSFLLNPNEKEEFKMHDLVRDMAILVTSEGDDKFWVQCRTGLREWQPINELESYKKISLMGNKICKLLDHELLLPHLDTFLVRDNEISVVPDEFFRGMEKLKVLDMSRNHISSLPKSLKQLKELRMLDLSRNRYLREISILGELRCLDILKLRRTGITNIPKEIGQLTNLRLLDVYSCEDLSSVTPGVISKLIRLEELYLWMEKRGIVNFLWTSVK